MMRNRFSVFNKSRLRERKRDVKASVRKCGIKTIEDVLNTSVLSNKSKTDYIRHKFTCYNNFLITFYRNEDGKNLRKELNELIQKVVERKAEVSELIAFNEELKVKLKQMNEDFKNNCKASVTEEVKEVLATNKVDLSVLPEIQGLTEIERKFLQTIPADYCSRKITEENKVEICMHYIEIHRKNWEQALLSNLKQKKVNGYLVETYLENRDKDFYPENFSDLDFITWKNLISKAKEWLYSKFDNDHAKAEHFICNVLPKWIENNADNFKSKILEK